MSAQIVMPLPGNHEPEKSGLAEYGDFLAYQSRFRTPSDASGGETNLYYAFRAASAHFIMLSSYSDFDAGSRQYQWLTAALAQVDRATTPWLIVSFHAPWYSSNVAHQGEFPSWGMRAALEPLLLQYGVDLVFSGHVHAYERSAPVALNQTDAVHGITYIGIGDGGNREGPADQWLAAPAWSAYREAKFGHGRLQIFNQTHAHWTWQKNQDSVPVAGDQTWLVRSRQHTEVRFGGGLVAVAGAV
jgi:3',5'-cyclic AMP phosphodiesterase CpdA